MSYYQLVRWSISLIPPENLFHLHHKGHVISSPCWKLKAWAANPVERQPDPYGSFSDVDEPLKWSVWHQEDVLIWITLSHLKNRCHYPLFIISWPGLLPAWVRRVWVTQMEKLIPVRRLLSETAWPKCPSQGWMMCPWMRGETSS